MSEAKPFCISKREVWEAFKRVKANHGAAGVDEQSIADFERDLKGKPSTIKRASNLLVGDEIGEYICFFPSRRQIEMLFLILLFVLLLAGLPTRPYSSGWGYYPSGGYGSGHRVGSSVDGQGV